MNEVKKTADIIAETIREGEEYWEITSNTFDKIQLACVVCNSKFLFTLEPSLSSEVSGIANLNRFTNRWKAHLKVDGSYAYYNLVVDKSDIEEMLTAISDRERKTENDRKKEAYNRFKNITS